MEPDSGPLHKAQPGPPPVPHAVHWLGRVETYGPSPVLGRDSSPTGEATIEGTVRKRRLCFAGCVTRVEGNCLLKRVQHGALVTDEERSACETRRRAGRGNKSASEQEEWFGEIEDCVVSFMRKWHICTWKKYIREAPARESGRSGGGDGKPGPCCGGSSDRGTGEARGKYKKPETAVRAARAPKASLVAQSVSD